MEDHPFLDVRQLHRRGLLRRGLTCSWSWHRGDAPAGSITIVVDAGKLLLLYRVTLEREGRSESVEQQVNLTHTACHYGGVRPWFLCPRCRRRCAILYGGQRFYCRCCHGLAYQSQRDDRSYRALHRAQKIRRRLGARTGADVPAKPKWMRWATYDRLMRQADDLEHMSLYLAVQRFTRYLPG